MPAVRAPLPRRRCGTASAGISREARARSLALRTAVTKDGTGALPANYGAKLTAADYAAIPRDDLGADAPAYAGSGKKPHNCAKRPSPDDRVSLWLTPPKNAGKKLRYVYKDGKLNATYDETGTKVKTTPTGIPT